MKFSFITLKMYVECCKKFYRDILNGKWNLEFNEMGNENEPNFKWKHHCIESKNYQNVKI